MPENAAYRETIERARWPADQIAACLTEIDPITIDGEVVRPLDQVNAWATQRGLPPVRATRPKRRGPSPEQRAAWARARDAGHWFTGTDAALRAGLLSAPAILDRGVWTETGIRRFLGDPHAFSDNPHGAYPTRYWPITLVEAVESRPEFQAWVADQLARRNIPLRDAAAQHARAVTVLHETLREHRDRDVVRERRLREQAATRPLFRRDGPGRWLVYAPAGWVRPGRLIEVPFRDGGSVLVRITRIRAYDGGAAICEYTNYPPEPDDRAYP